MLTDLSSEQYFKILDSLPDHVFIFSEQGEYLHVFGGIDNHVGSDCKEYIGKNLYDVMPSDMAVKFHNYIKATLKTNQTQYVKYSFNNAHLEVLPFESEAHNELWVEGILKPFIMDCGNRVVIWTARNVTDKHFMEVKLKEWSEIDELTGILNRRIFMSHLSMAIKSYPKCNTDTSFLMLDIDHFKKINDHFGHQIGDYIIKHVTNICQLELRDIDIIGRIGGEEFAIILNNTCEQKAYDIANRLRLRIQNTPYELNDSSITVTISIGLSQLQESDHEYKDVFSRSDKAMYYSKRKGRNRVSIYDSTLMSDIDSTSF